MAFLPQWPWVSRRTFQLVSIPSLVMVVGTSGFAAVYLTVEEAQQSIFPGEIFSPVAITLTTEQQKLIKKMSGVPAYTKNQKVWRTSSGGYFIVDEVIGKHEFITYAVGINPDGTIRQIEIMDYREAYGHEVRRKNWRRQFEGKTNVSPLKLNRDIKNISGATLSCRHVTEGVKRILVMYEFILRKSS